MNTKIIWTTVGVIVLIIIVAFAIFNYNKPAVSVPTPPVNNMSNDDLIHVTVPLASVLVQSPLVVKGEARGSWYFEASFPVKVLDANGIVLGQAPVQAKGEWMTNDFVPFEGTVTFTTPATETGTIIFQKDNPSGLPENDRSVSVPVYFTDNASKL